MFNGLFNGLKIVLPCCETNSNMKRQIKFRVWDYQMNRWANDFDVHDSVRLEFGIDDYFINIAGERALRWSFAQYIGLKDKNGKELFEGDIIRTGTDKLMKIGWSDKYASFVVEREGWYFPHYFGEGLESVDCELIGNIYQNTELLLKNATTP